MLSVSLGSSAARETRTLSIQNGLLGQNNGTGPGVNIIQNFLKDENAATAIEYGLVAAGIALAIIAVVNGLKLRFRSSQAIAAGPNANFGIKGALANINSSAASNLKFLKRTRSNPDRNFKFAALGSKLSSKFTAINTSLK
jgi:pilus assembly protein Flp/PilA